MRPEPRLLRWIIPALVVIISAVLFYYSWPRWLASFRYIPIDKAIKHYYSSGEIPSGRLPVLLQYAIDAQAIHDSYRFHKGISTLHFLRALDLDTPANQRRDEYVMSADAAAKSLETAPAQSSTWLHLAYMGWILHEEPETVLARWKMSVFTGRTDQSQYRRRVEIGIAHQIFLDDEAIAMLRDQLLLSWRAEPGKLISVLAIYDQTLDFTRVLIGDTDPVALQDMEVWLEKFH